MRLPSRQQYGIGLVVFALSLLHACAGTSRFYPNEAPENSLRLVEVQVLSLRSDKAFQNNRYIHEPLAAAGIQDAKTRDGSIGGGRVYCCGGKMDGAYFHYVYIPAEIEVQGIPCSSANAKKPPNSSASSRNSHQSLGPASLIAPRFVDTARGAGLG